MSKGSWRRPENSGSFQENYDRIFGRKTSDAPIVTEFGTAPPVEQQYRVVPIERVLRGRSVAEEIDRLTRAITGERHLVLSLDELRTIVFKTSVAYARPGASIQEAEWNRAAALRDALEDLGYTREAEMIGGAG